MAEGHFWTRNSETQKQKEFMTKATLLLPKTHETFLNPHDSETKHWSMLRWSTDPSETSLSEQQFDYNRGQRKNEMPKHGDWVILLVPQKIFTVCLDKDYCWVKIYTLMLSLCLHRTRLRGQNDWTGINSLYDVCFGHWQYNDLIPLQIIYFDNTLPHVCSWNLPSLSLSIKRQTCCSENDLKMIILALKISSFGLLEHCQITGAPLLLTALVIMFVIADNLL